MLGVVRRDEVAHAWANAADNGNSVQIVQCSKEVERGTHEPLNESSAHRECSSLSARPKKVPRTEK